MGDSDSEYEVRHVGVHDLGKNWYFEQGVGSWFLEAWRMGLRVDLQYTGVSSPYAIMHFTIRSHVLLPMGKSEM